MDRILLPDGVSRRVLFDHIELGTDLDLSR